MSRSSVDPHHDRWSSDVLPWTSLTRAFNFGPDIATTMPSIRVMRGRGQASEFFSPTVP